jgi:uncharacterized membrane protein SpoIIM required for sporulation
MVDGAAIRQWIIKRAASWRANVNRVEELRSQPQATVEDALAALEAYRGVARDLSTARRVAPNSRTTAGLESLYHQLHALISRRPRGGLDAIRDSLSFDIPMATRALRASILSMAGLMAVSAFAGWWLVATFPALIGMFASEEMIEHVEQGHLWTEGIINVVPSSLLSISILANNIVVSVLAFCAGIFLGLGTLYLIVMNGLMLGAAFAFVHQHGLAHALFEFIIAHGPVELSVICIAGACGVALGESIIRPNGVSRRDSFQACAHRVAPVLLLCAVLLVGCGFIEGFISPDPSFPMASRVVIGIGYWLIMWAVLTGRLLNRRPASSAASAPEIGIGGKHGML